MAIALGGTVGELKERMSFEEYSSWVAYRTLRGPLNLGMRMEWLMDAMRFERYKSHGGDKPFENFLRYHDQPNADASVSDVLSAFVVKR